MLGTGADAEMLVASKGRTEGALTCLALLPRPDAPLSGPNDKALHEAPSVKDSANSGRTRPLAAKCSCMCKRPSAFVSHIQFFLHALIFSGNVGKMWIHKSLLFRAALQTEASELFQEDECPGQSRLRRKNESGGKVQHRRVQMGFQLLP